MATQVLSAAKFALLSFRRNPAATFFTVVFPLLFLVIFGFIFGDEVADTGARVATFQVPAILALAVVSATFINLAISSVVKREAGQLKRLRSTPVSPLVWVLGQIVASLVIVITMSILVTLLGRLLFGVAFNFETLGVMAVSLLLGTAAFCALGLAVTALIPNVDAAPAVTNAIVFPLYFVSDIFLMTDADSFIGRIGDFFPIKPLVEALQPSYNPFLDGIELPLAEWGVIAIWGVVGIALASRLFRWMPQRDRV